MIIVHLVFSHALSTVRAYEVGMQMGNTSGKRYTDVTLSIHWYCFS